MNIPDEVVKIEISHNTIPANPYTATYCVLVNATVEEVIECAEKYPKAFVFTFDTTPVDRIKQDTLDYTPLQPVIEEYMDEDGDIMHRYAEGSYKPWMERLVQRLYIGNFKAEDHKTAIDQFVENSIGKDQELIYSKGYNK
jgi:hypothetical protein